MATLFSNTDIGAWDSKYDLGVVWNAASPIERDKAVQSATDALFALTWKISPFDANTIRNRIEFLVAVLSRYCLETGGAIGDPVPEHIHDLLVPYLKDSTDTVKAGPMRITNAELQDNYIWALVYAESFPFSVPQTGFRELRAEWEDNQVYRFSINTSDYWPTTGFITRPPPTPVTNNLMYL